MINKTQLKRLLLALLMLTLLISPSLFAKKSRAINLKGFVGFVDNMRQEWKIPGCAIAIVKDGKIVFAKGFGYRDAEKKLAATEDTLFAIGSCTKAFTSTLLGILVDEGKLDWNTPVREYLPDFRLQDEVATRIMTPLDLLTHRSGLPRHDLLWYGSGISREEIYKRLRYLEPTATLREKFQYNNLMYMTAGYMAGKIAGTTWEKLLKTKLIEPLAMKTTNLSVEDSQKTGNFSLPYGTTGKGKDKKVIAIPFRNIDNVGPAGSINSCVTEMANWLMMNLDKGKFGGKQIISGANLEIIHTPQIVSGYPLSKREEFLYSSYALGWGITSYRGHPVVSHSGGIDGFISFTAFLPRDNAGVVILTNCHDGGTNFCNVVSRNVFDRVTGKSLLPWAKRFRERAEKDKKEEAESAKKMAKERVEGTSLSHKITAYTGEFEHPAYGLLTISLDETGGKLKAKLNDLDLKIEHYHYDIFDIFQEIIDDEKFKAFFLTDVKGNIGSVSIALQPGVKDIVFTRMPEKKMREKKFLQQFVGTYDLQGMEAVVTLKGNHTLVLTVTGQPPYELEPYKDTSFNIKNLQGFAIKFLLDAAGKVTALEARQPNGIFPAKKIK